MGLIAGGAIFAVSGLIAGLVVDASGWAPVIFLVYGVPLGAFAGSVVGALRASRREASPARGRLAVSVGAAFLVSGIAVAVAAAAFSLPGVVGLVPVVVVVAAAGLAADGRT